jgi:hypothetical protein
LLSRLRGDNTSNYIVKLHDLRSMYSNV